MTNSNGGRIRRRLSLLAGGSLAAASIVGIAGLAALAPSSALAANECGDPNANGATADAFACSGTHTAISYPSTNGNLTLTLTNGPTVTTGGLSVTGTGANAVTINRSDATAGAGDPSITNTSGAGFQASTVTGNLVVDLIDGDPTGGDAPLTITGTSRGVLLQSGGTGASLANRALSFAFTNGSISATGAGGIGVEAVGTSPTVGLVRLELGGSVSGDIGVRASNSGTTLMQVFVTGEVTGLNGAAVQLSPTGPVTLAVSGVAQATNLNGGVIEVLNINATRTATVNNSGTIRSSVEGEAGYDDVAILVAGGSGNATIGNSNDLFGSVRLLNTGTVNFNNDLGLWYTTGASTFGAGTGAAILRTQRNQPGVEGLIVTNFSGAATSFDFGNGAGDTFNHAGTLAVGGGAEGSTDLVITGLENWNNSGRVFFGVGDLVVGLSDLPANTDGVGNDRISAQGAAFVGETTGAGLSLTSSEMFMDVSFATDQLDCSTAVSADCLDLRGGSATGSTMILANVVGGGVAERVVLVDVSGAGMGTNSPTAFTIDPESIGYVELDGGAALEGGLFLYSFGYDEEAKQYALVADQFGGRALEVARLTRAVTEPWRTATGTWHTRQLDLRDAVATGDADAAPGVWLKLAGNFSEETRFERVPAGVEYETSADQRTTALVGGVDLVRMVDEDAAFVIGLTASKLDSELDYTGGDGDVQMDGHSLGAYASFVTGRFFVDGIVNRTSLDVTVRDLGNQFETSATATGYQLEGGYRAYRFGEDEGAYLEPLATVSYVETDMDDLTVGPATAQFEGKSLRGALGLRLAGDAGFGDLAAKFSFTGRVWREFQGENATTLSATYANATLLDEAPETLGDVGVQVGLFTLGDRASIHAGAGVKFAEDYLSTDAALGFRIQW